MNEIRLFLHELETMPEYSRSIPTGTVLWKMWRRREYSDGPVGVHEYVGQYVPPTKKGRRGEELIGIRWFKVTLKYGPAPPIYNPPDWGNYARYLRERMQEWALRQQQ